jgi:hypothetical protein
MRTLVLSPAIDSLAISKPPKWLAPARCRSTLRRTLPPLSERFRAIAHTSHAKASQLYLCADISAKPLRTRGGSTARKPPDLVRATDTSPASLSAIEPGSSS